MAKSRSRDGRLAPALPAKATRQAVDYFDATNKVTQLFHLIVNTILVSDFVSYTAARALDSGGRLAETRQSPDDDDEEMTPGKLAESKPGPRTKALRRARQPLLELFLGRAIDNFETYVVSMIREVLRKQPAILSSSTYTLDVKSILEHGTIDSLIHDLVERKVSDLSYRGFKDLENWCQKQGIPLVVPAGKIDEVVELIATRNIIAHNRSLVDQKYLAIVKASRFKLGEIRALNPNELFAAISLMGTVVEATDKAVASNFGLDIVDVTLS